MSSVQQNQPVHWN